MWWAKTKVKKGIWGNYTGEKRKRKGQDRRAETPIVEGKGGSEILAIVFG